MNAAVKMVVENVAQKIALSQATEIIGELVELVAQQSKTLKAAKETLEAQNEALEGQKAMIENMVLVVRAREDLPDGFREQLIGAVMMSGLGGEHETE